MRENPPSSASIPHFVSMHKVFLVACVLCLFHKEGYCATISSQRSLDDQQISLDDLKRTTLCNDCLRRSKGCPYCLSLNREVSLEKRRENSLLLNSIEVKTNSTTGQKFLSVNYPLKCDPSIAYHPSKSNYSQARQNSIRLRKKLLKLDLLESFDEQLSSDIKAGFCTILRGQQVTEILNRTHYCSTINYVLKPSSESTPLRIVTNASFHHVSKSLNANCVPGLTELPPIQHLLLEFFINPFIAAFDIRKCYRSIHTLEENNDLRIIPIWQDKDNIECRGILKFQRICFGM